MLMTSIQIKNKAEKQYAELLESKDIDYIYQPNSLCIDKDVKWKIKYKPDFYLPKTNEYIEVVGTHQAFQQNKEKYKKVMDLGYKLKIVNSNGEMDRLQEWPFKKKKKKIKENCCLQFLLFRDLCRERKEKL